MTIPFRWVIVLVLLSCASFKYVAYSELFVERAIESTLIHKWVDERKGVSILYGQYEVEYQGKTYLIRCPIDQFTYEKGSIGMTQLLVLKHLDIVPDVPGLLLVCLVMIVGILSGVFSALWIIGLAIVFVVEYLQKKRHS